MTAGVSGRNMLYKKYTIHMKTVLFTLTKIDIVDYIHNGITIPKLVRTSITSY